MKGHRLKNKMACNLGKSKQDNGVYVHPCVYVMYVWGVHAHTCAN